MTELEKALEWADMMLRKLKTNDFDNQLDKEHAKALSEIAAAYRAEKEHANDWKDQAEQFHNQLLEIGKLYDQEKERADKIETDRNVAAEMIVIQGKKIKNLEVTFREQKERADKAEAVIEQLKGNALNFNSGAKTRVILKGQRIYTDTTHDPFPRLEGDWKGDEEDGKPKHSTHIHICIECGANFAEWDALGLCEKCRPVCPSAPRLEEGEWS